MKYLSILITLFILLTYSISNANGLVRITAHDEKVAHTFVYQDDINRNLSNYRNNTPIQITLVSYFVTREMSRRFTIRDICPLPVNNNEIKYFTKTISFRFDSKTGLLLSEAYYDEYGTQICGGNRKALVDLNREPYIWGKLKILFKEADHKDRLKRKSNEW